LQKWVMGVKLWGVLKKQGEQKGSKHKFVMFWL